MADWFTREGEDSSDALFGALHAPTPASVARHPDPERPPPRDPPAPERAPIPPEEVSLGAVARGSVLPRQSALAALKLVSPDAYAKALALYDDERTRGQKLAEQEQGLIGESQARRAPLEAGTRTALGAYGAAVESPRPVAPTLVKMPTPPDLTPRPWLDPEGRDALRTITQGLGALAVGVAGLAVGAPKTMLRYYREALEDWQKDEHERGNAKWREFQGEVQRVEGDNADALKIYDLMDRQYGANVAAKRAAVLTHLDALGLEDHVLKASMLPLEASRKALHDEGQITGSMLQAAQHLDTIELKQAEIAAKAGKLADPKTVVQMMLAREQETDPVKQRALDKAISAAKSYNLSLAQARADQGVAAKEVVALDKKLLQTDEMERGLRGLWTDYRTLQKAGLLPEKPTTISGWVAGAHRQFGENWTDEAQAAANRIQHFYPQKIVQFERSQGDIGARVKAAYGPLENAFVPYAQAKGIITGMMEQIDSLRTLYREQRGRLSTGIAAPGASASEPEAETED